MADAFWDPIYKKALEDLDLFLLIIEDSPDAVLLDLVRPHPILVRQASPFTKKGKITNRAAFIPIFHQVAAKDALLRRILLFGWIEANRSTLAFVSIPADDAGKQRLLKGEFGPLSKLKVLARLDPREGAKAVYAEVCAALQPAPTPSPAQEASAPLDPSGRSSSAPNGELATDPGAGVGAGDPPKIDGDGLAKKPGKAEEAMRRDLGDLRIEAKELRKKVKDLEHQRSESERRATLLTQHLRDTELALDEVRRALAQTSIRLHDLENRAPASAPSSHQSGIPSDRTSGGEYPEAGSDSREFPSRDDLQRQIKELEELIVRRDRSVERLEKDLADSRSARGESHEADRQAERLRERLAELERRLAQAEQARPVRLLIREAEPTQAGFRPLIETLHGEKILLAPSTHPPKGAVEGEWCLLLPAENGSSERLLPLEEAARVEFVGTLRLLEQGPRLESPPEWLPVNASIHGFDDGSPVAGVWLPGAPERPAGIQFMRPLPTAEPTRDDSRLPYGTLQKRLDLVRFDRDAFAVWARSQGKTWTFDETGLYNLVSAEAVLSEIRRILPVEMVCDRIPCAKSLPSRQFVRQARPGEVCSQCHEEVGESVESLPRFELRPSRILIAGGDAVGASYRETLGRYGLDVAWISGFAGLGGLREGLREFRLVVVILKQVSHTLLRELSQAARQSGVRLVYSPCRGISGVLRLLAEKLK